MNFTENEKELRCCFGGIMDTTACDRVTPLLKEKIQKALSKNPDCQLVFDLENTQYITSAFLRLCVLYHSQFGRHRFRILNFNENVKKVFEVSGLVGIMDLTSPGSQFDVSG